MRNFWHNFGTIRWEENLETIYEFANNNKEILPNISIKTTKSGLNTKKNKKEE